MWHLSGKNSSVDLVVTGILFTWLVILESITLFCSIPGLFIGLSSLLTTEYRAISSFIQRGAVIKSLLSVLFLRQSGKISALHLTEVIS